MIDVVNSIEQHAIKHIEKINDELNNKGHFVCAQQIDDLKDLMEVVESSERLKLLSIK